MATPLNLQLIVCPQCQGDLKYTREQVLFCVRCRLCYRVEEGVPQLSVDEALPLNSEGVMVAREKTAFFSVEEGKEAGTNFRLSMGTCKAITKKLHHTNISPK